MAVDAATIRRMWQFSTVIDFMQIFFAGTSTEGLDEGLIKPNDTLAKVHIALLEGPLYDENLYGRDDECVTFLCEKLEKHWKWLAEGEFPLTADNGEEISRYMELDPTIRLSMLKALCELRAQEEDLQGSINYWMREGASVSSYQMIELPGSASGTSYWYGGCSKLGYRLYREVYNPELKSKCGGEGRMDFSSTNSELKILATSLDDFRRVSEELSSITDAAERNLYQIIETEVIPALEEQRERDLKWDLEQRQKQEAWLKSELDDDDYEPEITNYDKRDLLIEEAIKMKRGNKDLDEDMSKDVDLKEGSQPLVVVGGFGGKVVIMDVYLNVLSMITLPDENDFVKCVAVSSTFAYVGCGKCIHAVSIENSRFKEHCCIGFLPQDSKISQIVVSSKGAVVYALYESGQAFVWGIRLVKLGELPSPRGAKGIAICNYPGSDDVLVAYNDGTFSRFDMFRELIGSWGPTELLEVHLGFIDSCEGWVLLIHPSGGVYPTAGVYHIFELKDEVFTLYSTVSPIPVSGSLLVGGAIRLFQTGRFRFLRLFFGDVGGHCTADFPQSNYPLWHHGTKFHASDYLGKGRYKMMSCAVSHNGRDMYGGFVGTNVAWGLAYARQEKGQVKYLGDYFDECVTGLSVVALYE